MSTTIEVHIEVKVEGTWHHYSAPFFHDIRVFGMMGCTRFTRDHAPVVECKGLSDLGPVTDLTHYCRKKHEADAFDASWLSSAECVELHRRMMKELDVDRDDLYFGYIFDSDIDLARSPGDMAAAGLEDYRMIFWFM